MNDPSHAIPVLLLAIATAALSAATPAAGRASQVLPEVPELLTLDWCLERARLANPDLERALASSSAASHRVGPAGALEDPRVGYEASNVPTGDLDFGSTPLSGHQFGLRQKLPFPGLLASRRMAAQRAAESSSWLAEDQQLLVASAVETAWAELGFAQRALAITQKNVVLLRKLTATAESRYRVGSGLQQDVLRAQVELTALLQEELERVQAIEHAESRLVMLLDLPQDAQLPRTADLRLDAPQPDLGLVLASLDEGSARLAAARKEVEAARARVRTAKLEGHPDVDLGIGYRIRQAVAGDPVDGDDFLAAGVTIRLPVNRSKWHERLAEQRALLRRAKAELRGIRASLVSRTRSAHAELVRAFAEEALLETGLVPQAIQSLASSRSAYQVGRIGFLELLDSQVRLLGAELRLVRARADKRVAFAALEAASGGTLR